MAVMMEVPFQSVFMRLSELAGGIARWELLLNAIVPLPPTNQGDKC